MAHRRRKKQIRREITPRKKRNKKENEKGSGREITEERKIKMKKENQENWKENYFLHIGECRGSRSAQISQRLSRVVVFLFF